MDHVCRATFSSATSLRVGVADAEARTGSVHLFAAGFQFWRSVIGAAASFNKVLTRKRPSGATSYCRPSWISAPPPYMRVAKSTTGDPGSTVFPLTLIGVATSAQIG